MPWGISVWWHSSWTTTTRRSSSSSTCSASNSPRISPSFTNDGRPKRWVVVRPVGAETGLLLALADGPDQQARVGDQTGGRVGFFLRVDDFDATYRRMELADVTFVGPLRDEPYGRVVVFEDHCGNRWDLLGPLPA